MPSERLSCRGLPPRPASSAARPHTRAVPAEKLRPGAPPGQQPSCSRPSPGGSASSGALFSDHCRKALPTSGQRRPPWGFRSTSPAPPRPPERLQAGWGGGGAQGTHSPAGLTTATPRGRPLRPPTARRWRREFPRVPTAADSRLTRSPARTRWLLDLGADGSSACGGCWRAPISQPPHCECWAGPGLAGLGTPAPGKETSARDTPPPRAGDQLRGCPGPQTGAAASCMEAVRPHTATVLPPPQPPPGGRGRCLSPLTPIYGPPQLLRPAGAREGLPSCLLQSRGGLVEVCAHHAPTR